MRLVARKPEERVRIMRKHIFFALVALLNGVVRRGPQLLMGYSPGGVIVAAAARIYLRFRLQGPYAHPGRNQIFQTSVISSQGSCLSKSQY